MGRAAALALILVPLAAMAAPVPTHLMPQIQVELRHKATEHPLGNTYEIVIRNTGASDLQVWTDRPYGLAAFIDCEVVNEKGERLSRVFQWSSPASEGDPVVLRETIPAKKTHSASLPAFNCVDDKKLTPGKHKVRVRFLYKEHNAVSDWLSVDVSEADIRTKNLVLGP